MGVDDDRRSTGSERRRNIVRAFMDNLSPHAGPDSAVGKFRAALAAEGGRCIITGLDIDSLVSSAMLAGSTQWRIGIVNDRNVRLLVHPTINLADLTEHAETTLFGVDLFSLRFPTISNHPLLFGDKARRRADLRERFHSWDDEVRDRAADLGSLNPSLWAGIGASLGSQSHLGLPYKYPLGTAQFLLAALEVAGVEPRLFDRQYLPWMIANADGGATSIRTYAWNAEVWWSALAAAAGPSSNSEAIYRLVTNQRPNEFLEADRRLRYDEPDRSRALRSNWNLRSSDLEHVKDVIGLITDWSGWPDPFLDGVGSLNTWASIDVTSGLLPLDGITSLEAPVLDAHFSAARSAVHANFSTFRDRGVGLGWMLDATDTSVESKLGVSVPVETEDEEESVPDVAI